jgi:hypothetical protein
VAASRSWGDDLARALRTHSRPITALFDLLRAADMEIADLPAACNSSRRRSSSWVQSRYFVAAMLLRTEMSGNRSCCGRPAIAVRKSTAQVRSQFCYFVNRRPRSVMSRMQSIARPDKIFVSELMIATNSLPGLTAGFFSSRKRSRQKD